jgi:glycosyltransferase involved in cell wall biosynthesis
LADANIVDLKAEVSHISLNAQGGAERLSVSVIKALSEMGVEIELSTFETPNPQIMISAYGEHVDKRLSKVRSLSLLSSLLHSGKSEADIFVNTHGDMLPLYRQNFSKDNCITYCHYPIAGLRIEGEDKEYLELLSDISSAQMIPETRDLFLQKSREAYKNMLLNSKVVTNSEYSRKAIFKIYGVDSTVLYPPVDIAAFQKHALTSQSRADDILVISRFHRSKKIHNAIHLAKLLKRESIGRRMVIVGNIAPDGGEYFEYLRRLRRTYGLEDYVRFEPSATFSRLIELVRNSKVYLHPLPGEPFGISTVESMSAGLIPVVPDIGGHTEFVPARFQFHTFREGVDAVLEALDAPVSDHLWMSHRASDFSVSRFIHKFKQIVSELVGLRMPSIEPARPLATQKMPADAAA